MPAKYKLDGEQFFMLTYPTTPADFDGSGIVAILERLGCNYRVGRELHQDGKPHFHAMCCFDEPYTDGDARRTFTVGTRIPNIRVRRTRPERGWDYVGKHAGTKEGHYLVGEKGTRPGGDEDSSERPSNDSWHEIILARTREEFFDLAARLAPRQLACSFTSLSAYADWKYRPVKEEYVGPDGVWSVPDELLDWVDENVRRPKGLVLYGATRLGKTVWARSLGAHYYAGGLWDMAEFHPQEHEYAIWDDMLGGLKAGYFNYKNWLGGQFAFTIQDKYGKKKSIKWGKPSIFICNTDPRDEPPMFNDRVGMDWAWLEDNCVFYEVKEAIFRASTE
ncbi:Replication-associated protein [Plant associated genomovirus 8]|nr:Replication-associated protein [Plant associated genomovirus 8]QCX29403.1 Replication-associated protein [Plant associated genomovirus 8]QCX29409.1 Replication-associated protein [Plant associated genomovirus 8]QCX29413.1 Replication-associated protein [Plant associated genomovirus 8]